VATGATCVFASQRLPDVEKILQENIAAKVRAIYKQYAPEKLALVPELMLQYKTPPTMYDWNYDWNSREKAMLEKLEHLYQMPGASDVRLQCTCMVGSGLMRTHVGGGQAGGRNARVHIWAGSRICCDRRGGALVTSRKRQR
jgi:hypothetical protein